MDLSWVFSWLLYVYEISVTKSFEIFVILTNKVAKLLYLYVHFFGYLMKMNMFIIEGLYTLFPLYTSSFPIF